MLRIVQEFKTYLELQLLISLIYVFSKLLMDGSDHQDIEKIYYPNPMSVELVYTSKFYFQLYFLDLMMENGI